MNSNASRVDFRRSDASDAQKKVDRWVGYWKVTLASNVKAKAERCEADRRLAVFDAETDTLGLEI